MRRRYTCTSSSSQHTTLTDYEWRITHKHTHKHTPVSADYQNTHSWLMARAPPACHKYPINITLHTHHTHRHTPASADYRNTQSWLIVSRLRPSTCERHTQQNKHTHRHTCICRLSKYTELTNCESPPPVHMRKTGKCCRTRCFNEDTAHTHTHTFVRIYKCT